MQEVVFRCVHADCPVNEVRVKMEEEADPYFLSPMCPQCNHMMMRADGI